MMDLTIILKELSALGLSPLGVVAVGILWKIQAGFSAMNLRVTVIEKKLKM